MLKLSVGLIGYYREGTIIEKAAEQGDADGKRQIVLEEPVTKTV